MGFWRGVGYFFASLLLIGGVVLFPIGIPLIIGAIVWIWALRKSGQISAMRKDVKQVREMQQLKMEDELKRRQDALNVYRVPRTGPGEQNLN